MENKREILDNYQKNLWCLQEVTGRLLRHMKGHDFSFRAAITGQDGAFSQQKLCALVAELLSGWAEQVRDGVYPDRPGEQSPAEGYLADRRELYGLYLYLAMRCSLCAGAYALTGGDEEPERAERTDFAFVLEQARRFARSWCVMAGPGGARTNEPFAGFDEYFGFHLYHVFTAGSGGDTGRTLTPRGQAPMQNLADLTNAGSMKRVSLKRLNPPPAAPAPEPAAPDEEEPTEEYDYGDEYGDFGGDIDPEEDGWDPAETFAGELPAVDLDALAEAYEREDALANLAMSFPNRQDYLTACERFAALYRQAPAEVLQGFAEELEQIVDLYLLRQGLTVLTDTEKTLDVYSRAFDGPCRQARRYARGILWKTL